MAIGYDSFTASGSVGSWSFDHTCGASATALFVGIQTAATSDTISGVTYNGVSMTELTSHNGSDSKHKSFGLISPATGTNSVSITYTNSSGNGARAVVMSYTGANGFGATNTQQTTSTPQTLSVTTTQDNSWLVGFTGANVAFSGTNYTAGTSTTLRGTVGAGGRINCGGYDSNAAKSPTGSYSLSSAGNSGFNNVQSVVELKEGSPVSGPTNLKTLNGIAKANIKTINGIAIANVKTYNGIA